MPKGNGNIRRERRKSRIDLELPIKALSVNKIYSGRKHRSVYYKTYRKQLFKLLDREPKVKLNLNGNLGMRLEVGLSSTLADLSNCQKALEDVISEWFNFNDRQIVYIEQLKFIVNKGDEYIKVSIYKSKRNIDKRSKRKNA